MHGNYPKRTKEADVDQQKTHQWLKNTGVKAETEGLIAAQDKSLATRSFHHRIINDGMNPQCRICRKYEETVDHIVSRCPELAKAEYIHRHNKAAAYLHWKICRHYNIETTGEWYKHQPTMVTENDKKDQRCLLIDVSITSERNTSIKVTK